MFYFTGTYSKLLCAESEEEEEEEEEGKAASEEVCASSSYATYQTKCNQSPASMSRTKKRNPRKRNQRCSSDQSSYQSEWNIPRPCPEILLTPLSILTCYL